MATCGASMVWEKIDLGDLAHVQKISHVVAGAMAIVDASSP